MRVTQDSGWLLRLLVLFGPSGVERAMRVARLAALACVIVLVAAAWFTGPSEIVDKTARGASYGDMDLYADIAERVRSGRNYYAAAVELQLEHGYPVRPFFAVRLPTTGYLNAYLQPVWLFALAAALFSAAVIAWLRALRAFSFAERLAFVGLLAFGAGSMIFDPVTLLAAEYWAGLLLSIALALRWPGCLALAAVALFFREFPVVLVGLMGALALVQRRPGRVVATALVLAGYALALAVHASAVSEYAGNAGAVSPGWLGLRGPAGFVSDLDALGWPQLAPAVLQPPLAFLPLLGWMAYGRESPLPLLWFAAFMGAIMILARPDNFYWAAIILPVYLSGIVFVPRFFGDLAGRRLGFH